MLTTDSVQELIYIVELVLHGRLGEIAAVLDVLGLLSVSQRLLLVE